jgi:hypothetical protein
MSPKAGPDCIVDDAGRWLAPGLGNEAPAPAPPRRCAHGLLCKACGKS